jgi:cardiolipin synthase
MLVDRYASRALSSATVSTINDAGINFRWFEPLIKGRNFYIGRRMHHKIFVADGLYSLVGGINISNNYNDIGDKPGWLDWAVFADGEVSAVIHQRCTQMWFRITHSQIPELPTPPGRRGNCLMRVRINDWVRNKNQISRSYLEMFHRANTSITVMSSYFLPGRVFRRNLRQAAARGVRVRIIVTKISDVVLAKLAERFFYPWLLRRNIELYEYRMKVLHAKIATYDDGWVTVGSYNVNDLSAYASIELNLDIHDNPFATQVTQMLDNIILEDCDRITHESLDQKDTWFNRAVYLLAFWVFRITFYLFTFYFRQEKPQ